MRNNILVIGNGYDIAHGLDTRYDDFINFIITEKEGNSSITDPSERKFISECIQSNGFINYFLNYVNEVPGWVDLERLLNEVTRYFEFFFNNYVDFIDGTCRISWDSSEIDVLNSEMMRAINCVSLFNLFDQGNSHGVYNSMHVDKKYYTNEFGLNKREILNLLKNQLEEVIKLLQIYLTNHVNEKSKSLKKISQIEDIYPSYVISFNYTNTYNIYGIKTEDVFHVHGSLDKSNLVLGFNDEEPENLDFVYFKKYFQRIQKLTGYIDENRILLPDMGIDDYTIVHFYGHSMDKTDEDIIKKLSSLSSGFVIYFYNQRDYEQKVINLIDVFGKECATQMIQTKWIRFVQC